MKSHSCHGRVSYLLPWVCWRIISFRLTRRLSSKTPAHSAERAKRKTLCMCVFVWFRDDFSVHDHLVLVPLFVHVWICMKIQENISGQCQGCPLTQHCVCVGVFLCAWLRGTLKPTEALSRFHWRQEGWRLLEWTYRGPQKRYLATPTTLTYIHAHIHSLDFGASRSNTQGAALWFACLLLCMSRDNKLASSFMWGPKCKSVWGRLW